MFEEPTFLVQMGHGSRKRAMNALDENYADGAILSPSNYPPQANEDLSSSIKDKDGIVLFDPQFYLPRTDKHREDLEKYDYFEEAGGEDFETSILSSSSDLEPLCRNLVEIQDELEVDAYIAPARFMESFSRGQVKDLLKTVELFHQKAEESEEKPVFGSVSISESVITNKTHRTFLLNALVQLNVDGFYITVEFDDENRYPLRNTSRIYSYLHFLRNLKKNDYEIITGFSNDIAHLTLGIGIDAFASGRYKNLKTFQTRRWIESDGFGTQVPYYHSYKLLADLRPEQDLDKLYQKDLLDLLDGGSTDADIILDGEVAPSAVLDWSLTSSWNHYFWCCGKIADEYTGLDREERFEEVENTLENAKSFKEDLEDNHGIHLSIDEDRYQEWIDAFNMIKAEM
ncbi:MAG: hypothetical protein ABEJ98_03145 [Candidatus Nanohaloarchaea archaeon]